MLHAVVYGFSRGANHGRFRALSSVFSLAHTNTFDRTPRRHLFLPFDKTSRFVDYSLWLFQVQESIFVCLMARKDLSCVFGSVLRNTRNRRGLTQEALAEATDLDRTYISLLERGQRQPTLETLVRLGEALRISPATLVARTLSESIRPL